MIEEETKVILLGVSGVIIFLIGMVFGGEILRSTYESGLHKICQNSGYDYYIQYSIFDYGEMRCDFYEVKEKKGHPINGLKFSNFESKKGCGFE